MAVNMPPPPPSATTPTQPAVIEKNKYGPSDVRYSEFLKLVNANKIEKVTFSADGTQLLGVDADGTRLKIESLPNDPALLSQLTDHKVCVIRVSCRDLCRLHIEEPH
jgi:cell division protease FtsH